jgi:septal ring factor EnvC (AmiA/AmiB activator)
MEDLFSDNRLGRLEEKIEGLIGTFKQVRDEKDNLLKKLESLESENRELKSKMAEIQSEKELVLQKVKGILDKIEQIEV